MSIEISTQIDPLLSGEAITAVAYRGTTVLATASCSHVNAEGIYWAVATLDLSAAGAGYVRVAFRDESNTPVSTGAEFEIDANGDEVDRLAYIDAATSSRLAPTEEGRTLDVTANGNAGIDWGNIDNPTTSINFSSTTVGTATNVGGASLRSGLGMAAANMDTQFSSITFDDSDLQDALGEVAGEVAAIKTKTDFLPSATAGQNGGLPTVDGNNRVAGIQGTITTLDALDTAQDAQHATTKAVADAIKTKSDQLTFTEAGKVDATAAVALESEDIDNIAAATAAAVGEGLGEVIWAHPDRELTSGANIVLAKGVGLTGLNDLSAAEVNSEVDTALADYDAPTNAEFEARTIAAASYVTSADLEGITFDDATILAAVSAVFEAVAGVPTTEEFEARTLAAAEYATAASLAAAKAVADSIKLDTGTVLPNQIEDIDGGGGGGEGMPRVNRPPGKAYQIDVSGGDDGTIAGTKPVRLRPGNVGAIAVGLNVEPLFGSLLVAEVGEPVVNGDTNLTCEALGPRDDGTKRFAMVELDGTATADEEVTIDVPVVMETGEGIPVRFTVKTLTE